MTTKGKKHYRLSGAQTILLGFVLLILAGAILLMLPFSSRSGEWTRFSDALFTATSASCVTGLVLYDTWTHWTVFGQIVILSLIQIGGMGVVTMTTVLSKLVGKKLGLQARTTMQEAVSAITFDLEYNLTVSHPFHFLLPWFSAARRGLPPRAYILPRSHPLTVPAQHRPSPASAIRALSCSTASAPASAAL